MIYDGIIGLVVGDALGVPFEFGKRGTFNCTGMTGHGTYNQPPGTWSDDSSMTLATLKSIVRNKKIEPADIMCNFGKWLYCGEFTPYGEVFDIGSGTRIALTNYFDKGHSLDTCGGREISDNGNGSLMRILPLAFVDHTLEDIIKVSSLTHAHEISVTACIIYDIIARRLIQGDDKLHVVRTVADAVDNPEFSRLKEILKLREDDIRSTGYVVDTLEAALWCFLTTDCYRKCVLKAVNLGGDTDTIAAVAGGLAGIYYGAKSIPAKWIKQIPKLKEIKKLCEEAEA